MACRPAKAVPPARAGRSGPKRPRIHSSCRYQRSARTGAAGPSRPTRRIRRCAAKSSSLSPAKLAARRSPVPHRRQAGSAPPDTTGASGGRSSGSECCRRGFPLWWHRRPHPPKLRDRLPGYPGRSSSTLRRSGVPGALGRGKALSSAAVTRAARSSSTGGRPGGYSAHRPSPAASGRW